MILPELNGRPQYSIPQAEKSGVLLRELNRLTRHHRQRCAEYARLLSVLNPEFKEAERLEDLPYLPVGLFKTQRLASVPDAEVFTVLTSSGTSGQTPSRVYLDRETASRQTEALAEIMKHVLGPRRLPMIVVDTRSVLGSTGGFSARGAGVLGLMNFGRDHFFVLDDELELDFDGLTGFLARHSGQPLLIFGFTFMVWRYFYQRLVGCGVDLSGATLVHSGGWKKLQGEAVDNATFRAALKAETGLVRVYNFYGMVEQVGSIFLEGEDGRLYAPNFADVIARDPVTRRALPPGQPGVLQVLSVLPLSYPGHSLLTEDLGVVHAVDEHGCGRLGTSFSVLGRLPRAELRGCSDTHAFAVAGR